MVGIFVYLVALIGISFFVPGWVVALIVVITVIWIIFQMFNMWNT